MTNLTDRIERILDDSWEEYGVYDARIMARSVVEKLKLRYIYVDHWGDEYRVKPEHVAGRRIVSDSWEMVND